MAQIVIVSGPSGAGKSAACESLCERYDRTVHLRTDAFFDSIRMGFIHPLKPSSAGQNEMVSRAVARAATAFAQNLYAVFIDGVIGPHLLPVYLEELRTAGVAVQFAILRPSLEATLRRTDGRDWQPNLRDGDHRRLYEQFAAYGDFAGVTIDNTDLSPDEAGDRIMAACGAGEALVYAP